MADHPVLQEAYADAQKAHDDAELVKVGADGRAAGGGWGSWLSSFVKTTAARSLPTRTEYENAIVQRYVVFFVLCALRPPHAAIACQPQAALARHLVVHRLADGSGEEVRFCRRAGQCGAHQAGRRGVER